MIYHFKVHKEDGEFWAECVEIENITTQADSMEELKDNMKEALDLHLSEPEDSKVIFPFPKKHLTGKNTVPVAADPKISFALRLRQARLAANLTQRQAAKQMGYENLSVYQKLENPKKANPELATLARVRRQFPDFDMNEILDMVD